MTSPTPRPLHALVVSQDEPLLHEIAWMLGAVGYHVQTAGDLSETAFWRRYASADILILDGRNIAEPTTSTFDYDSENPLYRILLYDPAQRTDFSAWYGAGAHDALRTPVSRGELLVRVRTAARYLEFERRMQVQSARSDIPGMYSRRGFSRKLRKMVSNESDASPHTLLMISIDWFAGICRKSGETVGRNLVSTAARSIRRAVGEAAVSAYFGDGRFAALLVGQSPAAAKAIAEALAKDFSSRESHHESVPRPTFTCAAVPWSPGTSADRLLNEALETLDLAEASGGNSVVMHGALNQEHDAWKKEMTAGNPFADVTAQDIMEPFPALLVRAAEQSEMLEALTRSGVPVRPFVDGDGRLLGVAADNDGAESSGAIVSAGDSDPLLVMPETIPHDASFPEIYEAFSSRGCATLVVVAGDYPLGYLTCDGFLSMIDAIDSESFASTDKSPDELAYLVVPATIGEPALACAAAG